MDLRLLGPIYMGWALGANDTANIFGTAVSSFMVRYKSAVFLAAVLVLLGALYGGSKGMATLSSLTSQTYNTAFIISLAAAITVTLMTFLKLPVSTSQAVVGAIMGIGIINKQVDTASLIKIFICWITTPLGASIISIILYILLSGIIRKKTIHFMTYDRLVRNLLILSGIYGAYSLGANNVANVTGVFYRSGILDIKQSLIIGGISISLGALTASKGVIFTVGRRIIPVDAFSAFIAVLAHSITLHIYAHIGVPVSSSQAIVGAVFGIGVVKGMHTVNKKTILKIISGWFFTPVAGMSFCLILYYLFC
ncbi:MAG: anion permease [Candidatus Omnitrophica bacterium]|nr:anion permease [Candidatus Omnitrophota bacterium]MCM8777028.1 anion permease [Candidatus Omnitrophota bacterium]